MIPLLNADLTALSRAPLLVLAPPTTLMILKATTRAIYLAHRVTRRVDTGKKASLACLMRVAGFDKSMCGPGAPHMKVSRDWKAEQEENATNPTASSSGSQSVEQQQTGPFPPEIEVNFDCVAAESVESPMTNCSPTSGFSESVAAKGVEWHNAPANFGGFTSVAMTD